MSDGYLTQKRGKSEEISAMYGTGQNQEEK